VSTSPETISPAPPNSSATTIVEGPGAPVTSLKASPDNPPWGVIGALLSWITSILLLGLVPLLCVQPYIAYRYRTGPPTQDILLADKTFVLLFVVAWIPTHLLTLALIWAVAGRLGKYSVRQVMGFSWSPRFRLGLCFSVGLLLFFVAWLVAAFSGGQRTDLDQILESSRTAALVLAFVAVATAPLVEEMMYRGLLYSALQRVMGQWFAIATVTLMFAGLHIYQYRQNIGVIVSISILSLALTTIRARTGKLLPCVIIHLVFNGIQSMIIVIEPYLRTIVEHYRPRPTTGQLLALLHLLLN
jgi:uncharacterized protein